MKITQRKYIFPMPKGLDKSAVPGTQDPSSLTIANNVILRTRPSVKKRPGITRIPYSGNDDGVQGVCQFFGTYGSGQISEIVRVRKGNIEVIRDGNIVDLGYSVSDTDTVVFEKFANVLLIHFQNNRPVYYAVGGTSVTEIPILSSHYTTPPGFGRQHDFRYWYGGRGADPHKLWVSAVNTLSDFSLYGGGFGMRVRDGDGDPIGLTGLSPTFRGDLYAYKWNSIYRIYRSQYGYGIDPVTDEIGAVHHNTIIATQNDVYSVSTGGINSLVMTDKYGAAETATVTFPIYEYFQESVNWSNANKMIMTYDKPSNTVLLSYTAQGSMVNNRVLGYNTMTKQFFEWVDCEYPVIGRYFDYGRQKTLIHSETHGTCYLDDKVNTENGDPIPIEIGLGPIFPTGDPKAYVTFTKAWLLARPTDKSVEIEVYYSIDGKEEHVETVDTEGEGYGSLISDTEGGFIGQEIIGEMRDDLVALPFACVGDGNAITFRIKQTPPDDDPDIPVEIYGIVFEYSYNEDTDDKVRV